MTNHEYYFGSPEKLAQAQIVMTKDISRPLYVMHPDFPCVKGFDSPEDFLQWLQEECKAE